MSVTRSAPQNAAPIPAPTGGSARPLVLSNARLVLADRVVENGWVACVDGRIAEIGDGGAPESSQDLGGHLLTPGLVELHTDHLESHYMPRPGVYWDPLAAVISYDAQLATCGITTVLDSLRVWREEGMDEIAGEAELLAGAIGRARDADMLRADHFLHLRCEVPMPHTVAETSALIDRDDIRLVSLMDHTPGQRQFRDEAKLRAYYRGKKGGCSDAELDARFEKRREYAALHAAPNYARLVKMAQARRLPLASHDDTTLEHVRQSIADGVALAEFPTTAEAARALHEGLVKVLMGAPNLVRGGSHSGNVSTAELAHAGVLDILSSDYVPASLLLAALQLPRLVPSFGLASAFATVTKTPAEAVGLCDRGEIAVGKRAD
ncbi:MAG: alpha-D-ribose 1-methylphosphonate 5-triphosphate diphosphatase, partial [Bradyrhizobiaceae bacterium]|nr:alpha-D-ribose 1-methylphosphonate 5-triphosphate diphosphatase [Bradyrhizobiaceae bacterium]